MKLSHATYEKKNAYLLREREGRERGDGGARGVEGEKGWGRRDGGEVWRGEGVEGRGRERGR